MKFRNVEIKRVILVFVSVIIMGWMLSFMNLANMGTDPFTVFNLGMSDKLGISFGNWQALLNVLLIVFVFIFAKDQIGWGTVANMFLVGYSFDFFSWLNDKWIPAGAFDSMVVRICVIIPSLAIFIFAVALYIDGGLGASPYDAIPAIIASKIKKPYKIVRIIYDTTVGIIGFLLGAKVGVVTVIMAFLLGPVISWVEKNIVEKIFGSSNAK